MTATGFCLVDGGEEIAGLEWSLVLVSSLAVKFNERKRGKRTFVVVQHVLLDIYNFIEFAI